MIFEFELHEVVYDVFSRPESRDRWTLERTILVNETCNGYSTIGGSTVLVGEATSLDDIRLLLPPGVKTCGWATTIPQRCHRERWW